MDGLEEGNEECTERYAGLRNTGGKRDGNSRGNESIAGWRKRRWMNKRDRRALEWTRYEYMYAWLANGEANVRRDAWRRNRLHAHTFRVRLCTRRVYRLPLMNLLVPASDDPWLAIATDNALRCYASRARSVYTYRQISRRNIQRITPQNRY